MIRVLAIAALLAGVVAAAPARAEWLISSISNQRVTITPNYDGEELVLFGSIERDPDTPPDRISYDLVITVKGPKGTMVTRRKERKLGIWLNADSREFINVPSYLAVFANRPISQIAAPDVLRRQQLGMNNIILTQRVSSGDYADVVTGDPFRAAFIRLKGDHGLYREDPNAISLLTPTLFRTGIPLPPEIPTGKYNVDIKVLSQGALITQAETSFDIMKVGFEEFVADSARRHGWLYGLATALMALTTGWLASIIFRRD
ncbi:MAG: TIGR02186 family protein [Hyphomicrobiales bacterium]|nr:MAG: TIGR02186 family protein [Hyphomicrobiales bacterium]